MSKRFKEHYLYVDLIVCGSVYRPVQSKTDNKYPAVYTEPAIEQKEKQKLRNSEKIKMDKHCVMSKQHVCAGLRNCDRFVHQLIRVVHDLSSQTRQHCSIH